MCKTNQRQRKHFLQINPSVSVKELLKRRWNIYEQFHEVREVEEREVKKALACYGHDNGNFVYSCKKCGAWIFQGLSCNSRICSNCGKRYTEQWSLSLSRRMFQIPHRHFVISIPSVIWPYLKQDRKLWKTYMDSAIDACNDYFPKLMRKHNAKVGIIVVLHPFGKDMRFQPHLHLIITEGAFDSKGRFIKQEFVPARSFAKCWQYHVSKNLQRAGVPPEVFAYTYEKYDGFYVWVHKAGRIKSPKLIANYIGRYARHPAIANSRITSFHENIVTFYYEEHREEQATRHDVKMHVDDFISALIQHIPEPQFKMIRYYGAYARRTKSIYKSYLQSSMTQLKLCIFGFRKEITCPYCGGELEFVTYIRKPPPELSKKQGELTSWIS